MRADRIIALLLAAAVVVAGLNVAVYAANGQPLLLGRSNTETKPTAVRNTGNGPALSLATKRSAAPLKVTSSRKVRKLNADQVDGLSGRALQSNAIVLSDTDLATVHDSFVRWSLGAVPAGTYHVSWDVNFLPLPDTGDVVCAVTRMNFSRQFAAERESGEGSWVATWLSGSGVLEFDPETMEFFCQSSGPNLQLKGPLTIAFQELDNVTTPAMPVVGRPTRRTARE